MITLLYFFLLYSPILIAPLFETQCSYVEAKLAHFLSWTRDQAGTDVGPFFEYPNSEYWAYADYKYIAMLFQDQPSMFEVISLLCTYNASWSKNTNEIQQTWIMGDLVWMTLQIEGFFL